MKARMMGALVNLSVVLGNHEQLQCCLAILEPFHLVVSLVVLPFKPIPRKI